MGILISIDEEKLSKGNIFLSYLSDLYESGEFFVLPVENGGYCIATNPFHKQGIKNFMNLFGEDVLDNLIFLISDRNMLNNLSQVPKSSELFMDKFWPGNLIIGFEPKPELPIFNNKYEIISEIWDEIETVNVIEVKDQYINEWVFNWLQDKGYPPILLGFYPLFDESLDVHDCREIFQSFGPNIIKIGFNAGQVQEGNKNTLKPLTFLQILDENDFTLLKRGIITEEQIKNVLKELDDMDGKNE